MPSAVPLLSFIALFLIMMAVVGLVRGLLGSRKSNDVAKGILDEMILENEDEKGRTTGAGRHIPVRAPIDERGVFYAEHSGLLALYEVRPMPADGLSEEEAQGHADILERQIVKLPEGFALDMWMDRSVVDAPEELLELPDHYKADVMSEEARAAKPVLQALMDSQREHLKGKREFNNRRCVGLEYHGNFAFGGIDVSIPQGIAAGWRAIKEKDPNKRKDLIMQFKSLWPGSDTAVTNLLLQRCQDDVDLLLKEGRRFFDVLAAEMKPRMVSQAASLGATFGLGYRQLDVEEGAKALYELVDTHPRRRKLFDFPVKDWGRLPSKLVEPGIDFGSLYGKRTEDGRVTFPGQFTVGGMPQKIYAIRQLPGGKIRPRLMAFLEAFPHMVTVRYRWHSLPPEEARKEFDFIRRQVAEAEMKVGQRTTQEDKRVRGEAEQIEDATHEGRLYGGLSILIRLSGWAGVDDRGRQISAVEDLELACERLETKMRALDIVWAEEVDHQDVAFLSMLPGKVSLQMLERLKVHSDVFTALAPLHDSFVPQPKITEMEPRAPFILTTGRTGRHEMRSPISGKTCMNLVLGEMGGGKSFYLNKLTQGWRLAHPDATVDVVEAGASMAVTAQASGGYSIPVGDPKQKPRINPFDKPLHGD